LLEQEPPQDQLTGEHRRQCSDRCTWFQEQEAQKRSEVFSPCHSHPGRPISRECFSQYCHLSADHFPRGRRFPAFIINRECAFAGTTIPFNGKTNALFVKKKEKSSMETQHGSVCSTVAQTKELYYESHPACMHTCSNAFVIQALIITGCDLIEESVFWGLGGSVS
jgi:hypothetical protein